MAIAEGNIIKVAENSYRNKRMLYTSNQDNYNTIADIRFVPTD